MLISKEIDKTFIVKNYSEYVYTMKQVITKSMTFDI